MHHQRALFGECAFLAGLGRQLVELADDMGQIILFGFRPRQQCLVFGQRRARFGRRRMQLARRGDLAFETAKGIEDRAVPRGIEQSALVMLAMDLDQFVAELAQQRDADRLVVDEGTRAAVARLYAAQNEIALGIETVVAENGAGGMRRGHVEDGGDAALLDALPDKPAIGTRADGKPERVEKNGFAGARLARQRAQAALERQFQSIDENDVADGQGGEHQTRLMAGSRRPM